ncbi:MAG: hypothetical protein V7643_31 [Mycobacterium sp.]|jgi:hypothetical protein
MEPAGVFSAQVLKKLTRTDKPYSSVNGDAQ